MTARNDLALKGRIAAVEKAEPVATALSAAEALADLNPPFTEGPGRRLGRPGSL